MIGLSRRRTDVRSLGLSGRSACAFTALPLTQPQLETVILASWGNDETVMSGFTDEPETFQIRRLLYTDGNLPGGDPDIDLDLVDVMQSGLAPR